MSQNGRPVDSAQIGWKDVVRVQGPTGILLRFDKLASEETPFMYHCHILDHEDHTMMRPFVVLPKPLLAFHAGHGGGHH